MRLPAKGTLLKIGDGGSPEAFTTVAQLSDIQVGLSKDTEDATDHDSPDFWQEVLATIKRGEVSIEGHYDPVETTHDATAGLIKEFETDGIRNFQIVWPNAGNTTWTIPCETTGFEPGAPVAGKLTFSGTLIISGKPTLA